jgi:hypothetical protein
VTEEAKEGSAIVKGGGGKRNRKKNKQGKGEQLQVPLGVTESTESPSKVEREESKEKRQEGNKKRDG